MTGDRMVTAQLSLDRGAAARKFVLSVGEREVATLSLRRPALAVQLPSGAVVLQLQSVDGELLETVELDGTAPSGTSVTFIVHWPSDRLVRFRHTPRELTMRALVNPAPVSAAPTGASPVSTADRPRLFRYSAAYVWGRLVLALGLLGALGVLPAEYGLWWQDGLLIAAFFWLLTCAGDAVRWTTARLAERKPCPILRISDRADDKA